MRVYKTACIPLSIRTFAAVYRVFRSDQTPGVFLTSLSFLAFWISLFGFNLFNIINNNFLVVVPEYTMNACGLICGEFMPQVEVKLISFRL